MRCCEASKAVYLPVYLSGAWPMLYSSVFFKGQMLAHAHPHNGTIKETQLSSTHCDVFSHPLEFVSQVYSFLCPRLILILRLNCGSETRCGDSSLFNTPFAPLRVRPRNTTPRYVDVTPGFLIKPTLALPAVNKHSWQRLTGSSSCAAITEECHEPVSKEHTFILDIKHLAADPARVTQ